MNKRGGQGLSNSMLSTFSDERSDDGGRSVVDSCEFDMRNIESSPDHTERISLARKENTAVQWMRVMVFVALLVTTVGVSTRVYIYTRSDQVQDFEHAFRSDAAKLLESFDNSVARRIEALDSLAVSITSFALATNVTFPYVTVPDFGIRCASTRVLSGSVFVQYMPLVSEAHRETWEAYVQTHRETQFYSSLQTEMAMLREQDERLNQTLLTDHAHRQLQTMPNLTWRATIENLTPNGSSVMAPRFSGGPYGYLPMWQTSPVTPFQKAMINFNSLSHPAAVGGFTETIRSGQAVIGAASNLASEYLGRTGIFFQSMLAQSQFRHTTDGYTVLGEPVSSFAYPLFDSFNSTTRQVVAVLGSSLYWRLYFQNVLPPNTTRGIICVVSNTFNQTFSYRIDADVTYLGVGDHHDTAYNHLVQESDVTQTMGQTSHGETGSFTSATLSADYCHYTIRIYPSRETRDQYVNGDPLYLTLVILSVFFLTSIVFFLFTVAVNRRQQVVMDRAVASSAIVSSLFPTQVRDQIYQENDMAEKKKTWQRAGMETHPATEKAYTGTSTRPIAQLFEHTTIMFGDLVGFTKWSSTRTPVEVFELLETLYQAFDEIAVRRRVFKVETIGDCYVAATGLPEPQDDHAVLVTRFASECIVKMHQLTTELAVSLGPDTASLSMRIGLHSGSVTGGVLRGQKSRFQLFGDTMNTAARMESNGKPGWIQVSQETANELIGKGKANWLTPRKDKIVAKGKGELQTYWVSPRSTVRSIQATSEVESGGSEVVDSKHTKTVKKARAKATIERCCSETFEI